MPPSYSNPHWNADPSVVKNKLRIPAKAFNIIWGNEPRYWQWIPIKQEERQKMDFEEAEDAAALLQVNWFEVKGKIDLSEPYEVGKTYTINYMIKFRADAFGWHSAPIKFKVKVNGKETFWDSLIMESYRMKPDVWHEVYGGQFTVTSDNIGGNVEFGIYEVESDWWKGSMVLAGVKIKPKI